MANEIKRLFDETALSKEKIIVMGGHRKASSVLEKTLRKREAF
jgi:hypothetical protein